MLAENSFHASLLRREFEPDAPNYTPRISGIILPDGSYKLSIIKSLDGDPTCCCRHFFEYDKAIKGVGHFIHTYRGIGDPLPSFDGEPKPVAIAGSLEEYANSIWTTLNADNKVSLYGYSKDIQTGAVESILINKNC
jgi:hypothetical protein